MVGHVYQLNPRGQSDPENGWVDAHEAMALYVAILRYLNGFLLT